MDEYGNEELDFSENDAALDLELDGEACDVTEIMDEGDFQEFDETADLTSDMPEESYVEQVMDDAPEEAELTNHDALERMSEYMAGHDYGRDDYETYSRDSEWRELNRELTEADGLEPAGDALEQMNDYMIKHNYGREDFAEYSQNPEWQELNHELMEADGLETEELPDDDVKVLTRDPDELMESGMAAIEQNMEAVRDDLHDKGIDDPIQVEEIIEEQRRASQQEFMHDAFGLDSASLGDTDEAAEANEEPVNQILEVLEEIDQSSDGDLESQIEMNEQAEVGPERDMDDSSWNRGGDEGALERDTTELGLESEGAEEVMERDMDEFGLESEESVEVAERGGNEADLDCPNYEPGLEEEMDDVSQESDTDEFGLERGDMDGPASESGMLEEISPEEIERIMEEGSREELDERLGSLMETDSTVELEIAAALESEELQDIPQEELIQVEIENVEAEEPLEPGQINYDAVYEELDEYDFGGIDCYMDTERLDGILGGFQEETWEGLSLDEQKESIEELADYVAEVTGLESPPEVTYYYNIEEGDYGGYDNVINSLEINEYMLRDSKEAADTVAHELWHAYQSQRALNPKTARDYQYQYNFDNYIKPEDDFEGYQEQLVEAEARAFAEQLKDRLSQIKGGSV